MKLSGRYEAEWVIWQQLRGGLGLGGQRVWKANYSSAQFKTDEQTHCSRIAGLVSFLGEV